MIISGSFTPNHTIVTEGFGFIPKQISLAAYALLFKHPQAVLNAYMTTIIVTVCGTFLVVFFSSMTGYVLSRKDYKCRNKISFYFFFTTLFGGGLIPWYILLVKYMHIKDHPLIAMIFPTLFSYFYIIIFRSFMNGIPDAISESAKIDGANDFLIYIQLILPLTKPVLATITLFSALGYWNDWYMSMLFVNNDRFFSLQYFLYKLLHSMDTLQNAATSGSSIPPRDLPTESFKLAMTVVVTGPIILVYPFLQKYFVKGLAIGAVKG